MYQEAIVELKQILGPREELKEVGVRGTRPSICGRAGAGLWVGWECWNPREAQKLWRQS